MVKQTFLDERVSHITGISRFGETEQGHNFGSHVVQLLFARLNRLLAEQLFVVLGHEVETSSLHQQVLALELLLLFQSVKPVLLALASHRIGALATARTHDVSSLRQGAREKMLVCTGHNLCLSGHLPRPCRQPWSDSCGPC